MKLVLAIALGATALCACVSEPVARPDAPRASDMCILMQQAQQAPLQNTTLPDSQRPLLQRIETQRLPQPSYQCGDVSYQTDPNQLGFTFTGIGFSADHRYARVSFQAVAGPLAASGHSCLYEAKDESWELRGCTLDWIT